MKTQFQPMTMRALAMMAFTAAAITAAACAGSPPPSSPSPAAATLAQVYFWRARPSKLEEYTRYIRDVAEPIDHAAQRTGAFLSVTTYMASDSTVPWTHMRVFLLRDSTQLRGVERGVERCRGAGAAGFRQTSPTGRIFRYVARPGGCCRRARRALTLQPVDL